MITAMIAVIGAATLTYWLMWAFDRMEKRKGDKR